MTSATAKQRQLLDTIVAHHEAHGWNPTRQELADQLGVSRSTVQQRLDALERKGYVEIARGCAGGIKVLRRE